MAVRCESTPPRPNRAPRLLPRLAPIAARLPASRQDWFRWSALATVVIVVFLRLVRLDQLQNELYGDIVLVYEYLVEIRMGRWPTHFTLSSGPLYHYLIVPVIALTAYAMRSDQEKALQAGFDSYLPKPIDRAALLQLIRNFLVQGRNAANKHSTRSSSAPAWLR